MSSSSEFGSVTIDGKQYATKKFASLEWMVQDLQLDITNLSHKFVLDSQNIGEGDLTDLDSVIGRYYDRRYLFDDSASAVLVEFKGKKYYPIANAEFLAKIPAGWRLPRWEDFNELFGSNYTQDAWTEFPQSSIIYSADNKDFLARTRDVTEMGSTIPLSWYNASDLPAGEPSDNGFSAIATGWGKYTGSGGVEKYDTQDIRFAMGTGFSSTKYVTMYELASPTEEHPVAFAHLPVGYVVSNDAGFGVGVKSERDEYNYSQERCCIRLVRDLPKLTIVNSNGADVFEEASTGVTEITSSKDYYLDAGTIIETNHYPEEGEFLEQLYITIPDPSNPSETIDIYADFPVSATGLTFPEVDGETIETTLNSDITCTFSVPTYTATITAGYGGSVSQASIAGIASGTAVSTSTNTLTIGDAVVTATANNHYRFKDWTKADGTALPATITADIAIKANFETKPTEKQWAEVEISEFAEMIPDVVRPDCSDVVAVLYDEQGRWLPLDYTVLANLYMAADSEECYNVNPIGENLFTMYLPKWIATHTIRLIYNSDVDIQGDTELNLPALHTELLIQAVTADLMADDGDKDPMQLERENAKTTALEDLIRAKTATKTKRIERQSILPNRSMLLGGAFIARRFR